MARTVLVAYASRYGGTAEIAGRIADRISQNGANTKVLPVDQVHDVSSFDTVIVGAGLYIGRWLKEAVKFVRKNIDVLASRDVWLFSSGPTAADQLADMAKDWAGPSNLKDLIPTLSPRGNMVFGGVVFEEKLSALHRWMMKKINAKFEDVRDWDAIDEWAEMISAAVGGS